MREFCCEDFREFRAETDNIIMARTELSPSGKSGTMSPISTFYHEYTCRFKFCPFCGGRLDGHR